MAKKRTSGIYLGTTRRQKNAFLRNLCIILALLFITVCASVYFVAWLLDAQETQLPADAIPDTVSVGGERDTAQTIPDAVIQTETLPAETVTEPAASVSVPVTGQAYKELYYTRTWSVMLDPGHGFDDIGTSSALLGDVNEATINLDIALRVREYLEGNNIAVIMTHDTNAVDGRVSVADGGEPPLHDLVLLTPEDRAVLANGQDIDLFVSIHCDSIPEKPEVSGMRTYYHKGSGFSDTRNSGTEALAAHIANSFGMEMGADAPTPLVKSMAEKDAYYVVREIAVPSVLCEVGFVTNETDAENLLDAAWREQAAQGIADGILAYISDATMS